MTVIRIKNKIGYIYKITTPNNRIYIGQTAHIEKRKRFYRALATRKQKLLHKNLIKYGFVNCRFDIIETCDCSILCEREIFWIDFYKSNIIKHREHGGLNLTDGGEGTRGYKHSPESVKLRIKKRALTWKGNFGKRHPDTGKNISEALTGKKFSKEHCKNIGISKLGNTFRLGSKLPEEQKLKHSLIMKGKPAWNKGLKTDQCTIQKMKIAKAKTLLDTKTGIYYNGADEAAFVKNVSPSTIRRSWNNINNKFNIVLTA